MRIIGHKKILREINHLLDADAQGTAQIAHTYLFVGPVAVGKTTLAHAFAAALVSGEVMCGELLTHPDIMMIKPEEVTDKKGGVRIKDIGVDVARMITAAAAQSPLVGVRRVIIVTEADRLTTQAQNALLKTLEEPAKNTIILFTTSREGRLLDTVRSRMQRIICNRVDDAAMMSLAEGFFDANECADAVAMAKGCPGLLMQWSATPEEYAWHKKMTQDADRFFVMSVAQRLTYAGALTLSSARVQKAIVIWMGVWRMQLRQQGSKRDYVAILVQAQKTLDALETTNASTRLLLEELLLSIEIVKR